MFIVTPSPMMEWMTEFYEDMIFNKDCFVLVASKFLNPEDVYYYQEYESNKYRDVEANEILDKTDKRLILSEKDCQILSREVVSQKIQNFKA